MSDSPHTHTAIPRHHRNRIIKEYVAEETIRQLAVRCRCEERTIYRDIAKMKITGEWWEWLERAMLRYGQKKDVSNETKFKEYTKLYGKKFITEKREDVMEHIGKIEVVIRDVTQDDIDQHQRQGST